MAYDREAYAPWSLTRKAGVQSATVDGDIKVPQYIQPVLDTGFVDEKGDWKGSTSSEEVFRIDETHLAIANGGTALCPQSTPDFIDMTGYNDIVIAIKSTQTGNCNITLVMGPDANSFANLRPVNPASILRGADALDGSLESVLSDGSDSITADVWNIFTIQQRAKGQKNMQVRIINNSGSEADIDFAFMRLV